MKKTNRLYACLCLLLFFALNSCSDIFTKNTKQPLADTEDSPLIQKLKNYNQQFQANHPNTKSLSWQRVTTIAMEDIGGAYVGGKTGGKIGGRIGSFFGQPIYGAAAGAAIGALAWGGFLSYLAYSTMIINQPPASFNDLYNNAQLLAFRMIHEVECPTPVLPSEDSVYTGHLLDEEIVLSDELEIPELVGASHNLLLDIALDDSNYQISDSSIFVVSDLARSIIQSDSLRIALQDYYEARMYGALFEEDIYPGSITDDIVEMFLQPYQTSVNNPSEVVSLANDYIAIIAASNELNDVEQTQVYSTLAVAVYTSYYWSDYYMIAE